MNMLKKLRCHHGDTAVSSEVEASLVFVGDVMVMVTFSVMYTAAGDAVVKMRYSEVTSMTRASTVVDETHTHKHTHARAHTHTHTHARAHARTHARTHAQMYCHSLLPLTASREIEKQKVSPLVCLNREPS